MERSTIVRVHEGLHARPATRFVKLAKSFESDVEIVKDGKAASAKSSVKLMLLGVKEDQEVTVRATGADAIEAVEALIGYLENPLSGLDEDAAAAIAPNPAGAGQSRPRPLPLQNQQRRRMERCAASPRARASPSARPSRISRLKSGPKAASFQPAKFPPRSSG